VLMLAGIDDSKLDNTASHSSSSFHSLPGRDVCYPCHPAPTIMGCLVLRLQYATAHASFTSTVVIRWSAVCFGFGYSYGRGFGYSHNWTSVTAPLSATAETRKTGFGRSL